MILVVNKVDRPDSRIDEVVGESMDLLLGLASDLADEVPDLDLDAVLNVPVVYASGKARLLLKKEGGYHGNCSFGWIYRKSW